MPKATVRAVSSVMRPVSDDINNYHAHNCWSWMPILIPSRM